MKPKLTFLLALTFLFLFSGSVYGEGEVYYCSEIDANGYKFDEKLKKYKIVKFFPNKFKMNLDRVLNTVELAKDDGGRNNYKCELRVWPNETIMHCIGYVLDTFIYNPRNGRFTISYGMGDLMDDKEAIYSTYGTCVKF